MINVREYDDDGDYKYYNTKDIYDECELDILNISDILREYNEHEKYKVDLYKNRQKWYQKIYNRIFNRHFNS